MKFNISVVLGILLLIIGWIYFYKPIIEENKNKEIIFDKSKINVIVTKPNIPLLPKVPVPVTPVKAISLSNFDIGDRSIKFSKRTPPGYIPNSFDVRQAALKKSNNSLGKIENGRVSAYLRGEYISISKAEKNLLELNFKILAKTTIDKENLLTSIIFTNKEISKLASKKNRGFAGSLRMIIDEKEKTINISNPIYYFKGFLQDDFNKELANKTLSKIISKFKNLKNSKDKLKYQILDDYQFMTGMPYYEDMIVVARGDNLLDKIMKNRVIYTQKLDNGAIIIGVKLSTTSEFINKIGRNNASLLPYPILIENGIAKILDPKYYISFMYPMLSMSKFMEISEIPNNIIKDCEDLF